MQFIANLGLVHKPMTALNISGDCVFQSNVSAEISPLSDDTCAFTGSDVARALATRAGP